MRVEVVRRGGLAGIPLRGSIDTSELPPEQARAAKTTLDALPETPGGPPQPDGFQYDLAAEGHSVTLNEAQVPDALRGIIDAALAHGTRG